MLELMEHLPDDPMLSGGDDACLYLGRTVRGREIWLSRDDVTRHQLIVGSTGSGKTELLLGMAASTIASGSGLFMVDGKGDISTYAKIHALAGKFGRSGDVLLVNFNQPVAADAGTGASGFVSHTVNPFAELPADAMVQIVVGSMESTRFVGGGADMWKGRAIALATAVINALAWLRDHRGLRLDVGVMRRHMNLPRVIDLASPETTPELDPRVRESLTAYLASLPGYQEGKGHKQSQTTCDQHGYLEMQLTRIFSMLCDVYSHIFNRDTANLDMRDVVLNRRIVVVLLPALSRSRDDIGALGRIAVALIKNMMANALAAPVEGDWAAVTEQRITDPKRPYLIIFDEVAHYLTDGMALMASQARSLGFGLVFATQDLASMLSADRSETEAILANTNTHVFMKLQNPKDFAISQYVPSEHPMANPMLRHAEETMRSRIATLDARLQLPTNHAQAREIQREILRLRAEFEAALAKADAYDLSSLIKANRPGDMVIARGGRFLRGRAFRVTDAIGRPAIALARFVPHRTDPEAVRRQVSIIERFRQLDTALGGPDYAGAIGLEPLPLAIPGPTDAQPTDVEAALRRLIDVAAAQGKPVPGDGETGDAAPVMLSLED